MEAGPRPRRQPREHQQQPQLVTDPSSSCVTSARTQLDLSRIDRFDQFRNSNPGGSRGWVTSWSGSSPGTWKNSRQCTPAQKPRDRRSRIGASSKNNLGSFHISLFSTVFILYEYMYSRGNPRGSPSGGSSASEDDAWSVAEANLDRRFGRV